MRSWVVKLLLLLFIPSLLSLAFTALLASELDGWLLIVSYAFAPLLSLAGVHLCFKTRWKAIIAFLTILASVAFNTPLLNWLFHSADDIVRYSTVSDLYNPANNALYFTFDTLDAGYSHSSSVMVTRTRSTGRRGMHKQTVHERYGVIPLFCDSFPTRKATQREVKAWITFQERPTTSARVCFERQLFDVDDYKKAVEQSACKVQRSEALFITPLNRQFITRTEWKHYFVQIGGIVASLFLLIGMILDFITAKTSGKA